MTCSERRGAGGWAWLLGADGQGGGPAGGGALVEMARQRAAPEPAADVCSTTASEPGARFAESPARGAESPARGAGGPVRGAESPARGAESPARGAEGPARGAEGPARG